MRAHTLIVLGLLVSCAAIAANSGGSGRMGISTLWKCTGSGIKRLVVTQTSGATVTRHARLELNNGDSQTYTLSIGPTDAPVGAPLRYVEAVRPPTRPSFSLTVHRDGTPRRDGHSSDLKADLARTNVDQTVLCKQ